MLCQTQIHLSPGLNNFFNEETLKKSSFNPQLGLIYVWETTPICAGRAPNPSLSLSHTAQTQSLSVQDDIPVK